MKAPRYPKGYCFLDGYWILPFIFLVWATCRLSYIWCTGCGKTKVLGEKPVPVPLLSTTNHTSTGLGSNLWLQDLRPIINCRSHGTASDYTIIQIIYKNSGPTSHWTLSPLIKKSYLCYKGKELVVFPRSRLNAEMAFTVFTRVLHGHVGTNHVEIYHINLNTRQLPHPIWVFKKRSAKWRKCIKNINEVYTATSTKTFTVIVSKK